MGNCFFIGLLLVLLVGNLPVKFNGLNGSVVDNGVSKKTNLISKEKGCKRELERLYSSYNLEISSEVIKMLCE